MSACCSVTEDVANKELCRVKFSEDDLQLLRDAIEDLYYFEFVIGELLHANLIWLIFKGITQWWTLVTAICMVRPYTLTSFDLSLRD